MKLSNPTAVTATALNAGMDTDIDLGANKLKTNHIAESTTSHGVTLDNNTDIATGKTLSVPEGFDLDTPFFRRTQVRGTGAAWFTISDEAGVSRCGIHKTLALPVKILSIVVYLKKDATATGTVVAKVRNAADSVVDTSTETYNIATDISSSDFTAKTFTFATKPAFASGAVVRIVIEPTGLSGGANIKLRGSSAAGYANQSKTSYESGAWTEDATDGVDSTLTLIVGTIEA